MRCRFTNKYTYRILKFWILSVGEIQKLLILQLHVIRLRANLSLLLVLIPTVRINESHIHKTDNLDTSLVTSPPSNRRRLNYTYPAYNNGDLGWNVTWSVVGSKDLRSDDIANTIAD